MFSASQKGKLAFEIFLVIFIPERNCVLCACCPSWSKLYPRKKSLVCNIKHEYGNKTDFC